MILGTNLLVRQYVKTNEIINITDIRQKLRDYSPTSFEIHEEADSMEALEAMLRIIHNEKASQPEPCQCLSHRYFNLRTLNTYTCKCENFKIESTEKYTQNLIIDEFITEIDFNYKVDLTLNPLNDSELIEKSNLFKLKSFEDILRKQVGDKNSEKKCENCQESFEHLNTKLEMIPEVFTIQLVWGNQNASRDQILQFLKSLPGTIDLSKIFETTRNTQHALRGMIVRLLRHYIYLVRSDNNIWSIINDSYSKTLYTGDFYCVVLFLLRFHANPVGLFYEDNSGIRNLNLEMESTIWVYFEKKIYLKEIFFVRNIKFDEYQWRCFFCNSISNEIFSSKCQVCQNTRITTLEKWICTKCYSDNPVDSLVCDSCLQRRFESESSKGLNVCDCPRQSMDLCKKCDHYDDCVFCDLPIYFGMSVKCLKCKKKIIGLYCVCDDNNNRPCCRFCYEKLVKCGRCENLNFLTDKNCNSCGFRNSEFEVCKKCGKIGSWQLCQDCESMVEVFCVLCKAKVHPGVCFLCPVCDEEFESGYCEKCDYDIQYDRFVCGDCRLKVSRCFACEIGVFLDGDLSCHLCMTKVQT